MKKNTLSWLWLSLVVIVADLGSKYAIVQNFNLYDTINVLPIFNITYARNYGAAFSFLANHDGWQTYFFLGLAIVISFALVIMLYRNDNTQAVKKLENSAYALIIGGALGNAIDRAYHGYVVDFLDFYWNWEGYHFATFNIADIAISVGAGVLILASFLEKKEKQN